MIKGARGVTISRQKRVAGKKVVPRQDSGRSQGCAASRNSTPKLCARPNDKKRLRQSCVRGQTFQKGSKRLRRIRQRRKRLPSHVASFRIWEGGIGSRSSRRLNWPDTRTTSAPHLGNKNAVWATLCLCAGVAIVESDAGVTMTPTPTQGIRARCDLNEAPHDLFRPCNCPQCVQLSSVREPVLGTTSGAF